MQHTPWAPLSPLSLVYFPPAPLSSPASPSPSSNSKGDPSTTLKLNTVWVNLNFLSQEQQYLSANLMSFLLHFITDREEPPLMISNFTTILYQTGAHGTSLCHGSQVSMDVAWGGASLLSSHGRGPLDYKEIQPVHPKEDQSWVFFGRTDAKAETPILWPPHVVVEAGGGGLGR